MLTRVAIAVVAVAATALLTACSAVTPHAAAEPPGCEDIRAHTADHLADLDRLTRRLQDLVAAGAVKLQPGPRGTGLAYRRAARLPGTEYRGFTHTQRQVREQAQHMFGDVAHHPDCFTADEVEDARVALQELRRAR